MKNKSEVIERLGHLRDLFLRHALKDIKFMVSVGDVEEAQAIAQELRMHAPTRVEYTADFFRRAACLMRVPIEC